MVAFELSIYVKPCDVSHVYYPTSTEAGWDAGAVHGNECTIDIGVKVKDELEEPPSKLNNLKL